VKVRTVEIRLTLIYFLIDVIIVFNSPINVNRRR